MRWIIEPAAATPLAQQIAANVRRGITTGELEHGERMPTAKELSEVLGVNSNTVLAAYRALREEGTLEFRRGRPVRVARSMGEAKVLEAARELIEVARSNGYTADEVSGLLSQLQARRP